MKPVVVYSCQIQATSTIGTVVSSPVIVTVPSKNSFVDNKGIYFGNLDVNVPSGTTITMSVPGTTGIGVLPAASTVTIQASGSYTTDNNLKVVLLGDHGTSSLSFNFTTTTSPPSTVTVSVPITVTVIDAGQTSTTAD